MPSRTLLRFLLLVCVGLLSLTVAQDCMEGDGECANPEAAPEVATPSTANIPVPGPFDEGAMEVIDPKCPDREHLMICAGAILDTNKNGKLDRDELQTAIDSLPWWARGVLKILGSVDKMMLKCDVDGDDAISIDYDMEHNKETCLATCFKRRAFKGAFFPECDL
jgi:hypothetical protein